MQILNARLGLANNSSSTHSLIFAKSRLQDSESHLTEFGWDFWTAASFDAKNRYLALLLYQAMKVSTSEDVARSVVEAWTGEKFNGDDFGYIDHQSVYALPADWDGNGVDRGFFTALRAFVLRPDVAILGGNDNTEPGEHHPLLPAQGPAFTLPIPQDNWHASKDMVCRYDGVAECWTLFDRVSGAKFRVRFNQDAGTTPLPTKAATPELTDIKCTDYCSFGCEFCAPAGTQITLADGTRKPIEDIQVGECVTTFSASLTSDVTRVAGVYSREYVGELIEIEAEDGRTVLLTPEHEVFTTNRGWVKAGEITEADDLCVEAL